jgi:hypothetical protein
MEGQFNPIFEPDMELELTEVDGDGVKFGISRHFFTTSNLLKMQENFIRTGSH